ncbi:MAG: hypothetical protein Q9166_003118 [cf. Caloplaca sp. 2 TL-2023]
MGPSSSSDQDFQSARTSPECPQSSGSSRSDFHDAAEYPQQDIAVGSESGNVDSANSGYQSGQTSSLPNRSSRASGPITTHTSLSGAAPIFLPQAQADRSLHTIPQETANSIQKIPKEDESALTAIAMATTSMPTAGLPSSAQQVGSTDEKIPEKRPHHLRDFLSGRPSNPPTSTPAGPFNRPIYDNQVPGIPTHWIPIYGAGHGLFYDPVTKLFHGDSPPRPDLERSDGTLPEMENTESLPGFGAHREDVLHIQPRAVTDPLIQRMQATAITDRRYFCKCRNTWLARRHNCPDDRVPPGTPWSGRLPTFNVTAAIRPRDTISASSFTHDLAVGDLDYLSPAQRYAYDNNLPMPIAGSR